MASPSLTQSQLKELLHYDPDTGIFTNLVTRNGRALIGDQAGYLRPTGYVIITLNYKRYRAHRLAWLYMYGVWPKDQLDHINRVSHDNRIANLREVSNSENQQNSGIQTNNTSGHKGVSWNKGRSASRWTRRAARSGGTGLPGWACCNTGRRAGTRRRRLRRRAS